MSVRFNAPPGWPVPSSSWQPDDGWMPEPSWPAPPRGWAFWSVVDDRGPSGALAAARFRDALAGPAAFGTDRNRWLDDLRERAAAFTAAATDTVESDHAGLDDAGSDHAGSDHAGSDHAASDHAAFDDADKLAPLRRRLALVDTGWELDGLFVPVGAVDR